MQEGKPKRVGAERRVRPRETTTDQFEMSNFAEICRTIFLAKSVKIWYIIAVHKFMCMAIFLFQRILKIQI